MPTFSTITLENLLEPRIRESYRKSLTLKQQTAKSVHDNDEDDKEKLKRPIPNHIYISPALYITPEPTPIPDSSFDSLSPSPYVVNHKRRGGKAVNCRIDGFEIQQQRIHGDDNKSNGGGDENEGEEMVDNNFGDGNENSVAEDDFFDPRCDSWSVTSSNELNEYGKRAETSNQGEFFDADEDFSSDGSISNLPSYRPNIEFELHAARIGLLEEIEKRKNAEDALALMYSQWQSIGSRLSQAGFTFPTPSNGSISMQLETNPIEQLTQEVVVARFVAEAIGKGQARSETELAANVIIESKDQEISLLRDRLQSYEAVHCRRSRRNLEVMEAARRQPERKSNQRRWLWSCIGLSITIGASVIAYLYLPQTSEEHPLLTSSDSTNASCMSSSESIIQ